MMLKHKFNRLVNKWYDYYMTTIDSDDFKNYCKNHNEFLSDNDITNKSAPKIVSFSVCDIVDNDDFTKLINHLYKLDSKKFKVDCSFLKSTCCYKYDYIHLKYNERSYGYVANIEFLQDSYLNSIEILTSQINNYFSIIEYIFSFKTSFDDELRNKFILDNIKLLNKNDFRPFYTCENRTKQSDYDKLIQAQNELFPIICQHYITSFLYSRNGRQLKLPSLCYYTSENQFKIDTFSGTQFGQMFYNKNENYVVECDFEGTTFKLFAGDNKLPKLCVAELICNYGNIFYFAFLGQQYIKSFELTFSQYTSRKSISSKKLSFTLKLYYALSDDTSLSYPRDLLIDFKKDWEFYYALKKIDFESVILQTIEKYKSIFHNAYEHCKARMDIQTSKAGRIISYCALGCSIISLIISMILHFC